MDLNPAKITDIENKFRAIFDLKEQNSDNNASVSDMFVTLSEDLNIDKKIIREAFNSWAYEEKKSLKEEGIALVESIRMSKVQ